MLRLVLVTARRERRDGWVRQPVRAPSRWARIPCSWSIIPNYRTFRLHRIALPQQFEQSIRFRFLLTYSQDHPCHRYGEAPAPPGARSHCVRGRLGAGQQRILQEDSRSSQRGSPEGELEQSEIDGVVLAFTLASRGEGREADHTGQREQGRASAPSSPRRRAVPLDLPPSGPSDPPFPPQGWDRLLSRLAPPTIGQDARWR